MSELITTPPGVESGSKEALEHKLKKLKAYTEQLEEEVEKPYDPVRAGVLAAERIVPPERRATKSRLSDKSGSMTMCCIREEKEKRRQEEEEDATLAAQRKEATEQRRVAAQNERAAIILAFEACEAACTCGITPCPYAKWVRCPQCGPKKGLCRVRECSKLRQPLALTYTGPPLLTPPAVAATEADGE